jgi:thiamine pyrophosphate-dependent acetolactate synthase large subunit-like protein
MTLALKHATLERNVSHLIFPDEVQGMAAPADASASGPEGRVTSREITPPKQSVAAALELLRRAERPVVIVGHGARFRGGNLE